MSVRLIDKAMQGNGMFKLITRRQAIALGAVSAVSAFSRPARADLAPLVEAARKEGGLTWYIAQIDGETAERVGKSFTAIYPGVPVTVMRTTGQVAYERLLNDLKNAVPNCDVFSSTDISHYPALMAKKALANYVPQNAAGLAPAFQGLGQEGYYYPTTSTLHVLGYNTQKVSAADAPANWPDLYAPKWKNQAATGHPAFSGYTGQWVLAMRTLYGWSYFDKLADNRPQIGRSGLDPITSMNGGELKIGCVPLSGVLLSADKGNPIAPVYPTDGSILCIGPAAVLANAPHPNAGRLFMEYLLSQEFAQFLADNRIDPVRAGATLKPGAKPLGEVKLIRQTTAEIAKGVPEVIDHWRDTFGS
jgi:iron(III) transport system substrate-binding protein